MVPVASHWTNTAMRRGSEQFATTSVTCGVPQRSVLWPILFIMYSPDLARLIEHRRLSPHQVYGFCSPDEMSDLADRVSG